MSSIEYERLCSAGLLDQFTKLDGEDSAGSSSSKALPRDLYSTSSAVKSSGGVVAPLAGAAFPPAGKDVKPSRGFGGGAPESSARCAAGIAAEGAGFASLDSLKNNRHTSRVPSIYERPQGRGKFCGRLSVKGVDPKTGRTLYRRINCGSWGCSYCGPRKARTARAAIRSVAERLNLKYFLTLTLDPAKLENPKMAVPHLRLCFNKFREYLKRKYGTAPSYICVLEFTQKGIPHLHILFDRYIAQKWISSTWAGLGGGRIVFIKQVTVQNVARYLSKYLTKELFLSAPKGTRRITTARSIKLFPKFKSGVAYELVRSSIWHLLMQEKMRDYQPQADFFRYQLVSVDEENYLKGFETVCEC